MKSLTHVIGSLLLLFSLREQAFAMETLKTVEAKGEAYLSEETTPSEAKAVALNNARRQALEQAVGVVVHGTTAVYNYQLINDMVFTATKGLIIKEKILEHKCQPRDDQIICMARIEAIVKPLSLERKGSLSIVKAAVQRPDREDSAISPVFQKNDEIRVRVTVSEESYLTLFSVDQYGNISKMYPNDYCNQTALTQDKEFTFPNESQRQSGLKLRVQVPKGKKKAIESVLVIAMKDKANLLSAKKIENPSLSDLMAELSEFDQSLWTNATVGYEVRE